MDVCFAIPLHKAVEDFHQTSLDPRLSVTHGLIELPNLRHVFRDTYGYVWIPTCSLASGTDRNGIRSGNNSGDFWRVAIEDPIRHQQCSVHPYWVFLFGRNLQGKDPLQLPILYGRHQFLPKKKNTKTQKSLGWFGSLKTWLYNCITNCADQRKHRAHTSQSPYPFIFADGLVMIFWTWVGSCDAHKKTIYTLKN